MLFKRFAITACIGFGLFIQPACSQTTSPSELPEADTVELYVVPPLLAMTYQPTEIPQLLAFSPDNNALAFTTTQNTKRLSSLGEIWASQLHLWPLKPAGVAQTLVDANTTATFAHYGAPAMGLTWQADKILMRISDGDDEVTQLTYLTQQKRLENPNIGQYTVDEAPSLTALEHAIQQCFADWPANVVEHSRALWLQEGDKALYQAQYAGQSDDIWLIDVPNCQRQLVQVPAKVRGQNETYSLQHAVLNNTQLVLLLESWQSTSGQSKSFLLQTDINTLGTSDQLWLNWSYGLEPNNQFVALGKTQDQMMFLLRNSRQPCQVRLYSLGLQHLRSFMVDGHNICNAAVSNNGQLALTLRTITLVKKATHTKTTDRIWVVKPAFLARLAK